MSTNLTVSVEGLPVSPIGSTVGKHTALQQLENLVKRLKSGEVVLASPAKLTITPSAVFSSATVTFSGKATAADTVTVNGTALTATQQNATGTVTFLNVLAGTTVTVGSLTYTARAAPTLPLEFALGVSDTTAATNLAALVNAVGGVVTAASSTTVCTFRAVARGTAGNAIVLLSSDGTTAAVTGSGTLTGGAAVANNQWDPGGTASEAAAALSACVTASSTAAVSGAVAATVAAGVVTLKARAAGVTGNVTLTKSGSNIAVSGGGTLTGGALGTSQSFTF